MSRAGKTKSSRLSNLLTGGETGPRRRKAPVLKRPKMRFYLPTKIVY